MARYGEGIRAASRTGGRVAAGTLEDRDKISWPIKPNDRLTGLRRIVESGDGRPTKAQNDVFEELSAELRAQLDRLEEILTVDLPRVERLIA